MVETGGDGDLQDASAGAGAPDSGGPSNLTRMFRPAAAIVSFDRHELREILGLYGRKVAECEWRDYAIDFSPQKAVFAIFRRSSENPLYRIEKDPALARKQGAYAVVASGGLVLRRGCDLKRVIGVLEKKLRLVAV